jgi:hypothetical protein
MTVYKSSLMRNTVFFSHKYSDMHRLLFRYEILTKLLYYKDLFPVLGSPTRKRLNDLK